MTEMEQKVQDQAATKPADETAKAGPAIKQAMNDYGKLRKKTRECRKAI